MPRAPGCILVFPFPSLKLDKPTDAPLSQHLLLPQSFTSLAEPGKCQITITSPAPCRAVLLPLGCGAAACHLLLVAATSQGEEVAAACSTLAPLGALAGHDALKRPCHQVPTDHGAQQAHRHLQPRTWGETQRSGHHEQHKCILYKPSGLYHPHGRAKTPAAPPPSALCPPRCLADK